MTCPICAKDPKARLLLEQYETAKIRCRSEGLELNQWNNWGLAGEAAVALCLLNEARFALSDLHATHIRVAAARAYRERGV